MFRLILATLSLSAPIFAFAQPQNFDDIVNIFIEIIDLAFPALVALALLIFFWGLTKFIAGGGNEKSVEEGKKLMFWGVIGLFVMISFWGIVRILSCSFTGMCVALPTAPHF